MESELQVYQVDEFADVIGGGTPSTKDSGNFNGSIPWIITPKDLSNYPNRYISKGERNITQKGLENSSARLLPPNTVLLTTRAPVGYVAIAENYITTNQGFRSLVLKDGFDSLFIYYLLKSSTEYLKSNASGTTFGELSGGVLKRLKFQIPSYPDQRAIAHILGSLDDKIELNRQMNQTLEAMAQAIFKSWFVDFLPVRAKQGARTQTGDPVRAKMEGRDTGLPAEIANLFPDSFEPACRSIGASRESELGLVPKGWKVISLDKIAEFLNGLACQKYPPISEQQSIPVIKIRELRQGINENTDHASLNIPPQYFVNNGDVLFSWSGSLLVKLWCGGKGVLNQHVFKVSSLSFPQWFYYLWLQHYMSDFQSIAADKATTMGHIKRHHLSDTFVLSPPDRLLMKMTHHLQPLLDNQIANELDSVNLSKVRDTLLPKLISGELRVPDLETLIKDL